MWDLSELPKMSFSLLREMEESDQCYHIRYFTDSWTQAITLLALGSFIQQSWISNFEALLSLNYIDVLENFNTTV